MACGLFEAARCTCLDDRGGKRQCEAIIQNTLVLRAFVLMPHGIDASVAVFCTTCWRVGSHARGRRPCTYCEEFETLGVDS